MSYQDEIDALKELIAIKNREIIQLRAKVIMLESNDVHESARDALLRRNENGRTDE